MIRRPANVILWRPGHSFNFSRRWHRAACDYREPPKSMLRPRALREPETVASAEHPRDKYASKSWGTNTSETVEISMLRA